MPNLRRIFAAVALVLVLAPLIAAAPLFDPDEGLHAAIAQEMVARGDYVTPTFLGEPFLDKPILFFWAEAASLRVFGDNETAVRLPPLLFGLAGMLSVALLGRAIFGEAAGLAAGIVYGTMVLPFAVSQVAVHDIGLVPFMCVAAWCLARIALTVAPAPPRRIAGLSVLAGICLGLSILTKGLVGVVFAGIFAACLTVYRPPAMMRLAAALAIAVVVAALVAAPWYAAMEHAHPGYLYYYFVERHLQGYLTTTQRHAGRPFWYYLPIVLGGTLPWTLHLAEAVRSARPGPRLIVWAWFAIGLVFLSLGESKLVTYALPLFPPLAVIVGERWTARSFSVPPALLWTQIAVLALMPPAVLLALRWKYGETHVVLSWVVGLLSVLVIEAGRRARRHDGQPRSIRWIAQACVCSIVAMTLLVPYVGAWMTSRDLARAINAEGVLPPRVSVLDERIGSLVFYLDPALRAQASRERLDEASFSDAIARVRVDPEEAIVAVRAEYLPRFNRLFSEPPVPDRRAGTFSIFRVITLRTALQAARTPR